VIVRLGGLAIAVLMLAGCPVPPFTVKVEDELFVVTGVSGGELPVLSVVGAQEGTQRSSHRNHALVYWGVLTALDMQQLQQATQPQPRDYVRSASARAFLNANFT